MKTKRKGPREQNARNARSSAERHLFSELVVAGFALSVVGIAAADLTPDPVKARVEAAGYTNVQIVRRESTRFDAKAAKDGKLLSPDVDGRTGAITPEKEEHEHDRQS